MDGEHTKMSYIAHHNLIVDLVSDVVPKYMPTSAAMYKYSMCYQIGLVVHAMSLLTFQIHLMVFLLTPATRKS